MTAANSMERWNLDIHVNHVCSNIWGPASQDRGMHLSYHVSRWKRAL